MRSRNIKPGFFKNADLAECGYEARLLFVGLWCLADREGRLSDRPKQIKGELFPFDEIDVNAQLNVLHKANFIFRYTFQSGNYISIHNFKRHQNPHRNESQSNIPSQHENSRKGQKRFVPRTEALRTKDSTAPADSLLLIPDSGFLIPDSGSPKVGEQLPVPAESKPLTPIGKIVYVFKLCTGYKKEDKAWDKLNFARCAKTAKQLLDFFGKWEDAADCVQDVYEKLTSKGFTVTIETVVKHAASWKKDKSELEAKRGILSNSSF